MMWFVNKRCWGSKSSADGDTIFTMSVLIRLVHVYCMNVHVWVCVQCMCAWVRYVCGCCVHMHTCQHMGQCSKSLFNEHYTSQHPHLCFLLLATDTHCLLSIHCFQYKPLSTHHNKPELWQHCVLHTCNIYSVTNQTWYIATLCYYNNMIIT